MQKGPKSSGLSESSSLKETAGDIVKQIRKAVESVATFGIESLTGQRYELGDIGHIGKMTYLQSLESMDDMGISPNRLVTIRVAIVLAGGTTLFLDPEMPEAIETTIELLVLAGLLGDRVDGDLARHTEQCTPEGATLDAGADKVITDTSLTAISLYQVSQSNVQMQNEAIVANMASVTPAASVLIPTIMLALNNIDSQRKRTNNREAVQSFWAPPIPKSERKPAEKNENQAPFISKMKTVFQMLVIAGYIKKEQISNMTGMSDEAFNIAAGTLLAVAYVCGQRGKNQRTAKSEV